MEMAVWIASHLTRVPWTLGYLIGAVLPACYFLILRALNFATTEMQIDVLHLSHLFFDRIILVLLSIESCAFASFPSISLSH